MINLKTISRSLRLGADSMRMASQTICLFPKIDSSIEFGINSNDSLIQEAWQMTGQAIAEAIDDHSITTEESIEENDDKQ